MLPIFQNFHPKPLAEVRWLFISCQLIVYWVPKNFFVSIFFNFLAELGISNNKKILRKKNCFDLVILELTRPDLKSKSHSNIYTICI